ncbi:MAG: hypothetical protein EHM42_06075 [Planctomycetaceae bacterium]|nr:MAG: hypothetical protein EHM42_06075 [Planctomycetaceae bacterium]
MRDPDLLLLLRLGFVPGMTRGEYWRHMLRLLFSPRFQAQMTLTRLHANLVEARGVRLAAAWIWLLALLALAASGWWLELLLAYLLPVFVFGNMAALLQLLSEHTYVHLGQGRDSRRLIWSRLTHARFFGEALPAPGASLWRFIGFWLRMFFWHLPLRIWVVPGDLSNHDWHHVEPGDARWTQAAYARRDAARTAAETGVPYLEVWGLTNALDLTFRHLAAVPKGADLGEPESYGWIDPDLLSM